MNAKKIMFIVRWIVPSVICIVALILILFKNMFLSMDTLDWTRISQEVAITGVAGLCCGMAFSIYRPSFRRMRKFGDFLTGTILMSTYLLAVTEISFFLYQDTFGKDNYLGLLIISILTGIITAWRSWFTNLENEILEEVLTALREEL